MRQLEVPNFLRGKRISFDVDGVKADTAPLAIKLYNKTFKDNKRVSDLLEFDSIVRWINAIITDDKKAESEAIKIWNHQKVQSRAKPVGGAIELSRLLINSEIEVHYVTSRPSYTKNITLGWFAEWLPWVNPGNIHTGNDANPLQSDFKAKRIQELNIDIHFEDSIRHAEKISQVSPKTTVVLVRQPWNMRVSQKDVSESIIVAKKSRNIPKLVTAYRSLLAR